MSDLGAPPPPEQIDDDVAMIVGGHFTPDSIGPDAYAAVTDRVRAHPAAYLEAFERRFLGADFDPLAQSELYPAVLLEIVEGADPEAARATADRLLRHLDGALVLFDRAPDAQALTQVFDEDTVNLATRLDDRRRELRALLDRGPAT
ncbi:MAG TPA: hypothetical protein VHF25_12150 [Nitriliruptorales bacterium]|nr:hypothetical protein [Nitriliruptorales bacterium]